MTQAFRTLRKRLIKLFHGNIDNFQEHFCKRCQITLIVIVITYLKSLMVLRQMLFDRIRKAIANRTV